MVCKEINSGLYFNYKFINETNNSLVEIWDGEDYKKNINYHQWCKCFYIIDKWRCLRPEEIDENHKTRLKFKNYE